MGAVPGLLGLAEDSGSSFIASLYKKLNIFL